MVDYLVILFAKVIGAFCSLLGGGTNLPGQLALKMRPGILKRLVRGYHVILVTGTNGKTTTTAMLQNILKKTGKRAINSTSGANMKGGVVSCLIRNFPLCGRVDGDYAVLEVDEAYMRYITADIEPEVIAITNIFRDQMDRYGEASKTLALIEEACQKAPGATLVLNADEPLLGSFLPQHKRFFYGFSVSPNAEKREEAGGGFCKRCKVPFSYDFTTFGQMGAYRCPVCGFARPELGLATSEILEISADSSTVRMGDMTVHIPQAGAYNIYNALCAAACAKSVGVTSSFIEEGIREQKSRFGRQETVQVENAEVRIILIKNPAGAREAISSVLPDTEEVRVGVLLNDNVGDGTDVSWIYDVDFGRLSKMRVAEFLAGGTRAYDMAVRLETEGFQNISVYTGYDELVSALCHIRGRVYLFVTYSAMIGLRRQLHRKKYIQKLWF